MKPYEANVNKNFLNDKMPKDGSHCLSLIGIG